MKKMLLVMASKVFATPDTFDPKAKDLYQYVSKEAKSNEDLEAMGVDFKVLFEEQSKKKVSNFKMTLIVDKDYTRATLTIEVFFVGDNTRQYLLTCVAKGRNISVEKKFLKRERTISLVAMDRYSSQVLYIDGIINKDATAVLSITTKRSNAVNFFAKDVTFSRILK